MESKTMTIQTPSVINNVSRDQYREFIDTINIRFNQSYDDEKWTPMFRTDSSGLWDAFINNIPEQYRQQYNCNTCHSFIKNYGSIVTIDPTNGRVKSAIWSVEGVPELFVDAIRAMIKLIESRPVVSIFVEDHAECGVRDKGECDGHQYHHFYLNLPEGLTSEKFRIFDNNECIFRHRRLAYCLRAEALTGVNTLRNAILAISLKAALRAFDWLKYGQLSAPNEKVIQALYQFKTLRTAVEGRPAIFRDNIIWEFVGKYGELYHTFSSSSLLMSLLEDIDRRLEFDTIKAHFDHKKCIGNYFNKTAKASDGNIEMAEKLIAEFGMSESLTRKFPTFAELREKDFVWKPTEVKNGNDQSLFGHLKSNANVAEPTVDEMTTISWDRFRQDVLPEVATMKITISNIDSFGGILTAANMDAPPILRWDKPEDRNPFSGYTRGYISQMNHRMVIAQAPVWNLHGTMTVNGILALAPLSENMSLQSVMFLIDGFRDNQREGTCLFEDVLVKALIPVSRTIQQFSEKDLIVGESSVGGVSMLVDRTGKNNYPKRLFVTLKSGMKMSFLIDRFM